MLRCLPLACILAACPAAPPSRQLLPTLAPFDGTQPHVLYPAARAEACGPAALADAVTQLRGTRSADGWLSATVEAPFGRADCVVVTAVPATYGCAPRGKLDGGVRVVRPDTTACGGDVVDFEPGGSCPRTLLRLPATLLEEPFTCTCSGHEDGPVWGSGAYTRDSAVCVAARHAGAVSEVGGVVTVQAGLPCASYRGTLQNGVHTADWGAYGLGTYFFVGHGVGDCAQNVLRQEGPPPCPPSFDALPVELRQAAYTCRCDSASARGAVWGTDRYTRDSSVCGAAGHAGVLDGDVGVVTVKPADACPSFRGSERHGVQSLSWGAFPGSFFFGAGSPPACSAPSP